MTSGENFDQEFSMAIPMLETDPEIIDAQIAAAVNGNKTASFLNNFYLNLPGPGGVFRSMATTVGWLDKSMLESTPEDQDRFHSCRAHEATWETFFNDIDQALYETGTDYEMLERIKGSGLATTEIFEIYNRGLLPAYKFLRVLGYSHHDLQR